MNISAYTGNEIQLFMAMLSHFEGMGVTDSRFIRQRLNSSLTKRLGEIRLITPREDRTSMKRFGDKCPECGSKEWYPRNVDGVAYYGCKSCRYSRMLN